ncbi:MAG: helix-turn-helix transcriptional regulator [Acidimicrobiales bacterium]
MSADTPNDRNRRKKLAVMRKQAGLNQYELAEAIGASRSSIYRWEKGPENPQPRYLPAWAEAIGIPVDELFEILWSGDDVVGSDAPDQTKRQAVSVASPADTDDIAADLVAGDPSDDLAEMPSFEDSVVSLLGLRELLDGPPPLPPVVLAMSSFRGADSIRTGRSAEVDDVPKSFVQGEDDISNDVFFGKRDTMLANQISGALSRVGFRHPLYVEDRIVWQALTGSDGAADEPLTIRQYGEEHTIGVLIVVGLWSNLLATGLADWSGFPEFQMAGDPAHHDTRTIRICGPEGLRIIDLNASPETDDLGGNPAVIVARKLANMHTILVGGATSLSTLRLAELLAKDDIWRDLARNTHKRVLEEPAAGGAWVAIECPNAPRWKDRCRVVGSDQIDQPIDRPLSEIRRT